MAERQQSYQPPEWARHLKGIPTSTVKLAMTPTPINVWKPPGIPDNFKIVIKRDDMTGSTLSGNKIRKLEFLFSDALNKSCRHILTAGALQSNHCAAVSVGCAELGLQAHIFQWIKNKNVEELEFDGNFLTDRLSGAHFYLTLSGTPYMTKVKPKMDQLIEKIQKETGEKGYYIPMGGSDMVGIWGYIQCFEEIRQQGVEFDDLVSVWGTGGTAAGLAIGNYLCGSPYRCHGMRIGNFVEAYGYLDETLASLGITGISGRDIIQIHDYYGLGYGLSTPEELEYAAQIGQETGILLDGSYTGKAAYGLRDLTQNKPEVFKGTRIMFLHSGGVTSLQAAANRKNLLPHSTKSKITLLEYE